MSFYSDISTEKKYRFNIEEETIIKILNNNDNSYKHFRRASTSYANRKYVREYIFNKYEHKCNFCGSTKNLQIDHIVSVKKCYDNNDFMECNKLNNLQILCTKCNIKKSDNE